MKNSLPTLPVQLSDAETGLKAGEKAIVTCSVTAVEKVTQAAIPLLKIAGMAVVGYFAYNNRHIIQQKIEQL